MPGQKTSNPQQYVRQYSGPIDIDSVFTLTSDRTAYLTSPRRYAGQQVSDLENGNTYVLNAARTAWLQTNGSVGDTLVTKDIVIADSSDEANYTIPLNFSLDRIVLAPTENCSPYCSKVSGVAGDIVPIDATLTVGVEGYQWPIYVPAIVGAINIKVSNIPEGSRVVFIKTAI